MDVEVLKQKILDLAIRGKLVPQDPNDEPASVLIEKIKAEKSKLVKEGKIKATKEESYIYKGSDNCYYENDELFMNYNDSNFIEDIPSSWVITKMKNIGEWGAGATPLRSNIKYYNGNIPWLKTGELNNDYINDSQEKITQLALDECSLRINKPGDILIAMYGATIGKLGIANCELTTNQACCGCTPFPFIYNKYLFYYLMFLKEYFISISFGGAQPNISKEKILDTYIAFPKISEQIRICSVIESVFRCIDNIKTNYIEVQNYISIAKQKVLDSIFGPDSSYKSYYGKRTKTTLSKLIPQDKIGDGDWVLSENMDENGEYALLQLKHIGQGTYLNKSFCHVNNNFFQSNNCTEIRENFILINRLIADNMNVCILPNLGFKCITAVDVCWIAPSIEYNQKYLLYYLLSPSFQKKVQLKTSGTTRKRISKKNLISLELNIHDIDHQESIALEIEKMFKILDSIVS